MRTVLRSALALGAVTLGVLATSATSALAAPPEILGEAPSSVTPTTAQLEGYVTPNEQATKCKFEYGTTTAYGTTVPCEPQEVIEGGAQLLVANLTGLASGSVYHFRVVLENTSAEKAEGGDVEFATPALEAPIITSETVTGLKTSEQQLEARIIPNYQEASFQFEYATSEAALLAEEGIVIKGAATLPAVYEEIPVGPVGLHGLLPGPVYYYRVVATNATGASDGPVQTFQLLAAPLDSTGSASTPTRASAVVTGSVTPRGLPTTYQFLYIPQTAYEAAVAEGAPDPYAGARVTPAASVLNKARETSTDYTPEPVQALLEELTPNTTYHYILLATNELGATRASDATFTTAPPTPPVANIGSPEGISQLSATLTGSLDTQGLPTVAHFELGTTPDTGTPIAVTITSTSGTTEALAATLNGTLAPGTTYYYRLTATSQDGTSTSTERSFTTPAFPPVITTPTLSTPLLHYTTIAEINAKEARENRQHPPPKHHKKHHRKHHKRKKKK